MQGKHLLDVSGSQADQLPDHWEPILFTAEEIEAEIDRLADGEPPADGRRQSLFVHPRSTAPGIGMAPGIRVTLSVLRPGERTRPVRHNSTVVGFCVRGGGHAVVEGSRIDLTRYDAWNIPSYRTYWYENTTDALFVQLLYSNAPLLEKLHAHLLEDNPPEPAVVAGNEPAEADAVDPRCTTPFGTFALDDSGASLMPYETLISPPTVSSRPLHWRWETVKSHLDRLEALGESYVGRRLYLLYNPATGRTNGTSPSFFATITIRPPGIVDRPHRHMSAAINYFFHGSGYSRVAGRRYEWKAGDLMFTAPGWAVHNHASNDGDRVYELTIQDQPFHIATESLLWQEDLKKPPRVLGAEAGFATNRDAGESAG